MTSKTKRETLCLIGARGGSKGVQNKNIRYVGDFPLIAFPIVISKFSKYIDRTIVSTNSCKIAGISSDYGAEIIDRPDRYAQDNSTDYEWVSHTLRHLYKHEGYKPTYIIHLRATTPLICPQVVDYALLKIRQVNEATSLRSIQRLEESPYKMFTKEKEWLKPFMSGMGEFYNQPRQKFPVVYAPNGYVDILKHSTIAKGTLHGNKILSFETEKMIEVDCEDDLMKLNKFAKHHPAYKLVKKHTKSLLVSH